MSDRRTVTPADVPTALVDAAERALEITTSYDPESELALRDAIRAMLAVVLPMYELRLGAELGRLTMACPDHRAPNVSAICLKCTRYTALLGARQLIEGRDIYGPMFPRHALQEADDAGG